MRVGGGFGMYKDATGLTSVPTLAQVLSAGNSTGATDISVDSGQNIQWNNSGNIGRIIEGTFTANRTYTLPDKTGVIALGINVVTKSASYTAVDGDVVLATGEITITLPAAVLNARITVTKVDAGAGYVTIEGSGSETINRELTQYLQLQDESFVMISDGSNWFII